MDNVNLNSIPVVRKILKRETHTPTASYNIGEEESNLATSLDPISTSTKESQKNLQILSWILFISGVGSSSITPSVWFRFLYFEGSTPSYVGFSLALYFFGQMLGSSVSLYLYRKYPEKWSIFLSLSFFICSLGDFLYFIAPEMWVLFIARFISGFGSSYLDLIQEYVSEMTQNEFSSHAVENLSLYSAVSLVVGPSLTAALSFISRDSSLGPILFNGWTIPGLLSACLTLSCGIVVLNTKFSTSKSEEEFLISTFDAFGEGVQRFVPASSLLSVLMVIYFFVFMNSCMFEVMVIPFTLSCYGWEEFSNAIFFAVSGTVSAFSYIMIEVFNERVSELFTCIPSLLILGLGYLALVPFHFQSGSECDITDGGDSTRLDSGCACLGPSLETGNSHYVPQWRFIVGCLLISVAYHLSFVTLSHIYSKIMLWMSPEDAARRVLMLKSTGSFSMVVGPVWMSIALEFWGGTQVFILNVIFSLLACFGVALLSPKLKRMLQTVSARNVTFSSSAQSVAS